MPVVREPALGWVLLFLAGAAALLADPTPACADPPAAPALSTPPPVPLPPGTAVVRVAPVAKPPAPKTQAELLHEQQIAQAMALHDEARVLYQNGEYRSAIAKLEAAHALDPEGKELLYNLALIHERLGEFAKAEELYRQYLETETNPKVRDRVLSILKRLEGARKEVAPGAASPGPRAVAATTRAPAVLAPSPQRPRRAFATEVVVAGSVAAGAFLASGLFGLGALAKSPGSRPTTSAGVTIDELQADTRAAHGQAIAADAFLTIGAVAACAGVWLYVADRRKGNRDPAAAARVGSFVLGSAGWAAGGKAPRAGVPTLSVGLSRGRLGVLF